MFADHNSAVLEVLKESRLLPAGQIPELRSTLQATGKPLAMVAIDGGLVSRRELLRAIARYLGCEYLEQVPYAVSAETATVVPARLAQRYGVVPLEVTGERLRLLALDPFNPHVADDLGFTLHRDVETVVADPEAVAALLAATYGEPAEETVEEILAELPEVEVEPDENLSASRLSAYALEAPIIRLVDLILTQAIRDQASDIHFEPYEDVFRVRYRIDGALYEMAPPPRCLALPMTSRIKVLADLDIAERRVPQDGRIKLTVAGRAVDLRVSTLPTQFGESVVLRVLDKSAVNLDLGQLGLPHHILQNIRQVARRPNGIFIVTGPTGSGKTTTLYSALREVNTEDTKILTAEDPVEYEIEGLIQTAINPAVGLTFGKALRSFLRQDPDKILVGEIRDIETAQIAVQAALTGHLVFTTLHTNDSAGAVTRLVDMGVEPYLIAASIEAVLAQRLVRRICPRCQFAYAPDAGILHSLGLLPDALGGKPFHAGGGCPHCHQSGYRGRTGLFEMIMVDDRFRELVTERAATGDLRTAAIEAGMRSLREEGIRAICEGATSVEEVLKYTV